MNDREKNVHASRKLLSDKRLTEFLYALRNREHTHILAVKFICNRLADGQTLDRIFYDGSDFGYNLTVRQTSENSFHVGFGCQVDPMAGDGGEWEVTFVGDQVEKISMCGHWIS